VITNTLTLFFWPQMQSPTPSQLLDQQREKRMSLLHQFSRDSTDDDESDRDRDTDSNILRESHLMNVVGDTAFASDDEGGGDRDEDMKESEGVFEIIDHTIATQWER
jgi:hypothetical protein